MESHFGSEDPDRIRRQVAGLVVAAAEGGVVIERPIQPGGGRWDYWDTLGVDRHEWGRDFGEGGTLC